MDILRLSIKLDYKKTSNLIKQIYKHDSRISALAKKIDTAYQAFMKECGGMMAKFEISYVNQRNRVLGLS